jgi:hypothetical protein
MPRSVPPLARVIAGLDRLPDGQIRSALDCRVVALGSRQRVEPRRQALGLSVHFGISEIALDGEVESALLIRPSHPERGALRNVINAGRAAVDADGAPDEGA